MNFELIIFGISAVIAVFGATMMIAQRNPVASVLYMILSLIAQAVCYVQLGALFLGVILIVVYAGAIMVLFLFVIMLLNLRGEEASEQDTPAVSQFTKYVFSVLLTLELVFIVKAASLDSVATQVADQVADGFGSVRQVAQVMFTNYLYPFELTGILLLVALVGAVVLAKRERDSYSSATDDADDDRSERVVE
ncbi:MAG: NADH-quinone oxidoreductase subunit J [candidate division Zixibacteria bacterium]|nr:NADH-quinone oxidoreductase subunit J [candidate division Zixibacteria bacterium]